MTWRLFLIGIFYVAVISSRGAAGTHSEDRNLFASELYETVATSHLDENVVLSPAAIQTSMALVYYGAKGQTATEIEKGLRLGSSNVDDVVRRFSDFQQQLTRDNKVQLVNMVYVNEQLEFKANFKDVAKRSFNSDLEKADFHPPYNKRTAERINRFFEEKTAGKVKNIIDAQLLNDRTEGVVLSAATLSGPWQKAFKSAKTEQRTFWGGAKTSFNVETMWTLNEFKYGELADLDATAVELPYQGSDLAMVVLLPKKRDGLKELVKRVSGKDLLPLLERGLTKEKVEIYLPKFSVTFGVSLERPFKELGVTTMFSRQGDFGGMYRMFVNHFINSFDHKAFIGVEETGTEPALEIGALRSFFSRNKKMEVDHPFLFLVRNQDSIIFMGHIANYVYA